MFPPISQRYAHRGALQIEKEIQEVMKQLKNRASLWRPYFWKVSADSWEAIEDKLEAEQDSQRMEFVLDKNVRLNAVPLSSGVSSQN
jgi:hypothetical protein